MLSSKSRPLSVLSYIFATSILFWINILHLHEVNFGTGSIESFFKQFAGALLVNMLSTGLLTVVKYAMSIKCWAWQGERS